MTTPLTFPAPRRIDGRLFFVRHEIEELKLALIGEARGEPSPPPAVIELVPAARLAHELGISRRSVGRRIAALNAKAAKATEAAPHAPQSAKILETV